MTVKHVLRAGALLAILYVGASVVLAHRQARTNTEATRSVEFSSTPVDYGHPYEDVTFATEDGALLAGWYIPSQTGAAVVFSHGLGQTRQDMLERARVLADRGYGVLIYDLHAHGESDGERFATSWRAYADVDAALVYVLGRKDVDPARVGAFGFSVGASSTLRASALNDHVQALFLDGVSAASFADEALPSTLVECALVPGMFVYPFMLEVVTGLPEPREPQYDLFARTEKPVFLVSAGNGLEAKRVARYATRVRDLRGHYRVVEAGHGGAMRARPAEYAGHLAAFFDETLGAVAPHVRVSASETPAIHTAR